MCCIQFRILRWTLHPNHSTYEANVTKLQGNSFQPVGLHEEFSVMRIWPDKPSDRYNRCYPFMLCNMSKELTQIITPHKSRKGLWQCEYMGCITTLYTTGSCLWPLPETASAGELKVEDPCVDVRERGYCQQEATPLSNYFFITRVSTLFIPLAQCHQDLVCGVGTEYKTRKIQFHLQHL
jgi:hypothetical protein